MNNWDPIRRPNLGLMHALDEAFIRFDGRNGSIPNLRGTNRIIVASDYSGQHSSSSYDAYSFLLAEEESVKKWEVERKSIREIYLRDARRMSFKKLSDIRKMEALLPFLTAANSIRGLCTILLIDKSIDSIFDKPSEEEQKKFIGSWKPNTFEKLMRIEHFLAFLISGLCRAGQDLLWIADEDEIMANEDLHRKSVKIFGDLLNLYLNVNIGRIHVVTTKYDDGSLTMEDFAAIPDLAAGGVTHILNYWKENNIMPENIAVPAMRTGPEKVTEIMDWFSDARQSLKRLVLFLEPAAGNQISINRVWFHGNNDGDFPSLIK